LAIDHRIAQREVLRHAHQGRVHDRFAVRVIVTRGLTGDLLPRTRSNAGLSIWHQGVYNYLPHPTTN
jgi:hypothetical protein